MAACDHHGRPLNWDSVDKAGNSVALACARYGWWDILQDVVVPKLVNPNKVRWHHT